MLNVQEENSFRRDIKKSIKRGKNLNKLKEIVRMIADETPLSPKFRDHALIGNYVGMRECHIEPDWLLIYYKTNISLTLVRTGTHADLF